MSSTLFLELLEKIKIHITKLGQEDNLENLIVIVGEVYDRLEQDNKVVILKNILEKMLERGTNLQVNMREDGKFNFEGILEILLESFTLEGRDLELLRVVINYILENKFFMVENVLGFKISTPEKMKYMKMDGKKLVEVNDEEFTNIQVIYVNKLKDIKNSGRELSNLYGFMKEDKKGNITFKIFEKREGVTKTTQQATGSACSHFTIPKLRDMISQVGR